MSSKQECGSILVEALVAFTILAMAVIMNLNVMGSSVHQVVQAAERATAMRLAQRLVDQQRSGSEIPASQQGKEGDLIWALDVTELEPLAGMTSLRVVFRAKRGAPPRPEDILLETIIIPRLLSQ